MYVKNLKDSLTYNIYANWNTDTVIIDDLFNVNNLSNLTPEQLLVLELLFYTLCHRE